MADSEKEKRTIDKSTTDRRIQIDSTNGKNINKKSINDYNTDDNNINGKEVQWLTDN